MNISKKSLISGALGLAVLSGGIGVYAGTVIDQYKTPRGNIATVEKEDVHKNRIALKVNGKAVSKSTWYSNDTTYVPIRDVAEMLGASVNYSSATMSADIITSSKLLNLLGIKLQVPYYGTYHEAYNGLRGDIQFKMTAFNPTTNTFEGQLTIRSFINKVTGKLSETKMTFTDVKTGHVYDLNYKASESKYIGSQGNTDIAISLK